MQSLISTDSVSRELFFEKDKEYCTIGSTLPFLVCGQIVLTYYTVWSYFRKKFSFRFKNILLPFFKPISKFCHTHCAWLTTTGETILYSIQNVFVELYVQLMFVEEKDYLNRVFGMRDFSFHSTLI